MRYLLDDGYYMTDRMHDVSAVYDDNGNGFYIACDSRFTNDELVDTMSKIIPFITKSIA